jgi:hypothetical protein
MAWSTPRTFGMALLRTLWSRLDSRHPVLTGLLVLEDQGTVVAAVVLYVDNLLICTTKVLIGRSRIKWRKGSPMHDLRSVSFHLRMNIKRNQDHHTINIHQHSYIPMFLGKFRMDESRAVATPLAMRIHRVCPTKKPAIQLYTNSSLEGWCTMVALGQGNPPAVRDWTWQTIWFESTPMQTTEPHCLGRVSTRTGLKPTLFWPGLTYCRASFSLTQYFRCNQVFELRLYHNIIYVYKMELWILFHLPLAKLSSDYNSLSCCEIMPKNQWFLKQLNK